MSEDFSDKVRALLEDPEMLAKIAAIAGGLGSGSSSVPAAEQISQPPPAAEKPPAEQVNAVPVNVSQVIPKLPENKKPSLASDPRISLLNSLKPFLREERRSKVDNLTKALTIASLIGTISKDKKQ